MIQDFRCIYYVMVSWTVYLDSLITISTDFVKFEEIGTYWIILVIFKSVMIGWLNDVLIVLQAVDYGVHRLWEHNNVGVIFEILKYKFSWYIFFFFKIL